MGVIYDSRAITARLNAVISTIGSGGKLKLYAADNTLLVTFTLANPPPPSAATR
jgi:hypothetical protein